MPFFVFHAVIIGFTEESITVPPGTRSVPITVRVLTSSTRVIEENEFISVNCRTTDGTATGACECVDIFIAVAIRGQAEVGLNMQWVHCSPATLWGL